MGIGVVLLVYFVFLSVLAGISGGVLMAATGRYLQTVPARRKKIALAAGVFPFACVIFAGIWFVAYSVINDNVFHHDPMIGDGWYTNIGNGYAIDMIDVTDHGVLHPEGGLNSSGAIDGVRRLQIVGDQIYGTRDTKIFQNFGSGLQDEDAFFKVDTKTHVRRDFPTEAAMVSDAEHGGIGLKMEPIADVYQRNRLGWFDWAAGIFLITAPAYAFWRLVRYVWLVKQDSLHVATGDNVT
jgi:hypothetical protein